MCFVDMNILSSTTLSLLLHPSLSLHCHLTAHGRADRVRQDINLHRLLMPALNESAKRLYQLFIKSPAVVSQPPACTTGVQQFTTKEHGDT